MHGLFSAQPNTPPDNRPLTPSARPGAERQGEFEDTESTALEAPLVQRWLPLLLALFLVLGAGLVQGLWTQRWGTASAIRNAAARLDGLPTEFGDWSSVDITKPEPAEPAEPTAHFGGGPPLGGGRSPLLAKKEDPAKRVERLELTKQLALAGAESWWVRRFTSPRHQETVLVMLLCGRTNAMCAHRPEHCYASAGYDPPGSMLNYTLRTLPAAKGAGLGDFRTGLFVKEDSVGNAQLRIFWSWLSEGKWQAPSSPRWDFAGRPYLYKLYVLRDATSRPKLDDDPAADLMRQMIPTLTERLAPVEP